MIAQATVRPDVDLGAVMRIHAVDPGFSQSAYVVYSPDTSRVLSKAILPNEDLVALLRDLQTQGAHLVIEKLQCFGMPVGEEVLETAVWTGRFVEAFRGVCTRISRVEVKTHVCGLSRAKDANVRQVLIDRFGPTRERALGSKKSPGPLYGIRRDLWQALALAITAAERA